MSNTLDAKITQKMLANKYDLKKIYKKVATKGEIKAIETKAELKAEQDKVVALQTSELILSTGQSYFNNDGAQLY